MSSSGKNSSRQEEAILALAAGATAAQAGKKVGVSERTVQRWQTDPEFQSRVAELRRKLTERATGRLIALSVRAARKLGKLMNSSNESTALKAARAVLELSLRGREHVDLAAEVAELRRLLAEKETPGPRPARGETA